MSPIPRRSLLRAAAVAEAAAQFSWAAGARSAQAASRAEAAEAADADPVTLDWLEDGGLGAAPGSTVGVPWPKGAYRPDQTFALTDAGGKAVPVQSWPIAYWPDGSLKWSAHAVSSGTGKLTLAAGDSAAPAKKVTVHRGGGTIDVSTGVITAKIGRNGSTIIKSVTRGPTEIAKNGRLVLIRQPEIEDEDQGTVKTERFDGAIGAVTVEQDGPVRAVVRIDGKHRKGGRSWLPFSIRLYFYAGADSFRMVHTITYDGTQEPGKASGDFIRGLGVRFTVPMRDAAYDRHIRIGGEGTGLLREAVKGVTGLRRDPGAAVQAAQYAGQKLPDPSTWDQRVTSRLQYIPEWGDYTLAQLSADGFMLRKRTRKGYGWVGAGGGRRASGFGYVGGVSGGLSFGLRDFWEKHPAQLDIRDAHTDEAEVTLWLWSPEAQPMDLRFYHDGMGQDTYAKQLEGLEITYEDYEPEFGTPYGIARTSELLFWANESTPAAERLAEQAEAVRVLPQLAAPPRQLIKAKVFGPGLYSEPDRSTAAKARIEDHLDFLFTYYKDQVEQRRWYGFWDYGDFMHSYDTVRHQWRYDIGGYAWDNSELSPDLWLWFAYIRSGRSDIFRFAEALTRHTGEVDVYHLGDWAGLGTRHGVQHYADSAKQQRIANTTYRRYYYFLTADERVGDLMHANVDSDETFLVLDPQRKVRTDPYTPDRHALSVGFGTDWSGLVSAWLTEWERRGPKWEKARARVLSTMEGIAAQPNGFVQGSGLYDLDTGRFAVAGKPVVSVSHLSAVFGLNELCAELIDLVDMPKFNEAYFDYCRYFNATKAEQAARYGSNFGTLLLFQGHSRLDAYAAVRTGDETLAKRAWTKFYDSDGYKESSPWKTEKLSGPVTLVAGSEAAWVSSNDTALYGLAAIENLALLGDKMP
ncbi:MULTISPECIES: Tat pathway signal sequence domain protein [unclassified Streptomyces]|uniref:exo-rhamnogalacturonan lyase family protein n=1 Tax=unclassified Streptomyces TaxID=2593676 RepID=UPI002259A3EE|nr:MULTISPECIES: Tat pathway signal sequence domain protein [unclassified Streptomyces]MCX4879521.1 Tat pathway signal sequence domain protein [Streptomyces sp. NBC_00847]MCX5046831.1 Tat pathway signal sequence domain protein [Streptomyces sp. NBC_00474]